MSSNEKNDDHYDPFQGFNRSTFPFFDDNNYNQSAAAAAHPTPALLQNFEGFDPTSYMSTFTDYLHGSGADDYNSFSRAFDISCSSSDVVSPIDDSKKMGGTASADNISVGNNNNNISENPSTPNSSVSSSSNEAGEDSSKSKKEKQTKLGGEDQDGDDKSNKV